jgi:hypothetical protein
MDTAPGFIALLTCGVWDKLLAERRPRKLSGLELIRELVDEDRDRFALLRIVRSGHFHCFNRAKRKHATKNECDPGEKS